MVPGSKVEIHLIECQVEQAIKWLLMEIQVDLH